MSPSNRPVSRILRPFQRFAQREASGGIVLLFNAALALLWANSPWGDTYHKLWQTKIIIGPEGSALAKPLILWINDGLMAIFFLVVGLEIKREILVGELASIRRATLPIAAALGGMVVPALIYTSLNAGGPGAHGWGVPMATDIAFSLGVLALLGTRAPLALKVFLAAYAIVDDIGAVLVIALFYTAEISLANLGLAGLCFLLLAAANYMGVRRPSAYLVMGSVMWVFMLKSGVHATIAGVLLAFTIPARALVDDQEFVQRGRDLLEQFDSQTPLGETTETREYRLAAVHTLEENCEHVQTPLQRLLHSLHGWVSFFIMPLFALANAGVRFDKELAEAATSPIAIGVALGLFLGKPIGVLGFAWLAVRFRLAELPSGTRWRQVLGVGLLGGIGFTMALFIADLAFGTGTNLNAAKVAILAASLVSGTIGFLMLRLTALPPGEGSAENSNERPIGHHA